MEQTQVSTGLDVLQANQFAGLSGRRIGLLCNQASIDRNRHHALEIFWQAQQEQQLELKALFGPQHGLWGHTQDNMIEWEGYREPHTGLPVYSLYGQHRKPPQAWLQELDVLVVDLQDVGARYYTFVWTMALCMEACQQAGVTLHVLDRPNPLGGLQVEGPLVEPEYSSFVGLLPIPVRHGLTLAELARYFQRFFYPDLDLHFTPMKGWQRGWHFEDTGLTWGMPSPNMPSPNTALVYPGMCLLEGTNLSEGRGTTRPFEIFGAPWLDGWDLADRLNQAGLPGVYFRPFEFEPTFNKYQGQRCGGCFLHVTDAVAFRPLRTALVLLQTVLQMYPEAFAWREPPYEYEYEKLPIDILLGNGWLRGELEKGTDLRALEQRWQPELQAFRERSRECYLYPEPE